MAVSDQGVIRADDLLIDETGSRMIDRIGRIEVALEFLVGATADVECAHPGLHVCIQHVHSDVRQLARDLDRGFGLADPDPRSP